ncbi:radical SAM protein [Candidatus Omnitrophota bacterium]
MRVVLCTATAFHLEHPPLGLTYLKSSLIQNGHSVKCLDLSIGDNNLVSCPVPPDRNIEEYLDQNYETISSWVDRIETYQPDIVGITLWASSKNSASALALLLKRRLTTALIIGGGPDVLSYTIKDYLNYFDYLIEKEGELTLCQFLDEYQKNGKTTQTKGVWYKNAQQVCLSAPAERIKDLDSLAFPDFSDFVIESYSGEIPVEFSRGCNANCTFCNGKHYFDRQKSRSGLSMYQEIVHHSRHFNCYKFIFVGDNLLSATTFKEFMTFCDQVIKDKLKIEWRIYNQRVDSLIDETCVKKMVAAGLKKVTFGVESFSERVRQDMGKVASDAVTDRALSAFIDQGVKVALLMIYGYPIETEADFQQTLTWLRGKSERLAHICFNCFVVNSEYCSNRPGIVKFEDDSYHLYKWRSDAVDRGGRQQRFLRLIETLNALNVEYMVSDPHLNRYYRNWNKQLKAELEKEWTTQS